VERCRIIAETFKKKHPSVYTLSVRSTVIHLSMLSPTSPLPGILGDLTFKFSTHRGTTSGQISVYYGWNTL